MKKIWEFTGEEKNGLKRIRLAMDCEWGEKGNLGGWIEKESNLGPMAWVSGDAEVYGNAYVYGDAWVSGNAEVYGDAMVYGDARVYGHAGVYGNAWVYGDARVYGNAWVYGEINVSSGFCFGSQGKDWDVTELDCGDTILLIRDYQPEKQTKTITIDGKDLEISNDSYKALKEYFTNN